MPALTPSRALLAACSFDWTQAAIALTGALAWLGSVGVAVAMICGWGG